MKYYKRIDIQGKTITVESYSHNKKVKDAIVITKTEYNAFIASLPEPIPEPKRDLEAEMDELKARVAKLEIKRV